MLGAFPWQFPLQCPYHREFLQLLTDGYEVIVLPHPMECAKSTVDANLIKNNKPNFFLLLSCLRK